ncbi:hypothetical protein [Streptomyces sp. MP131-18]|uniref:hypothetical protein n=1 Tax=Streptomyces sp. MP131-18 TaxID=1857892 RepID=UPI0009C6F087|nr:hypothetical protein [Streptomyces sp. MP131-18]ONK13101.1 hypothetical protein STBA_38630 [Streptomyces sp. MP131-18]
MRQFFLGLLLGALSGGITYGGTSDGQMAAIIGLIVAILCWFGGVAAVIFFDD